MNFVKFLFVFCFIFAGCTNDIMTVWEYTDVMEGEGVIKFLLPPKIKYKRGESFNPQNVIFQMKSGMDIRVQYMEDVKKLSEKFRDGQKVKVFYRGVFQVNKRDGVEFERHFFKYEFVSAKKLKLIEV